MSSNVLWTPSTSGKLTRLRRASSASADPGSTQGMRKPRRASANVALPEAHPISQPVICTESSGGDHRLVQLLGVLGPGLLVEISGRIERHPKSALISHAMIIPVSAAPVRDPLAAIRADGRPRSL